MSAAVASSVAENKRFSLVTHDRFFVVIECDDPKYLN